MFKNSMKIMFFLILIMGTMVSVSSNSWMGAWMGLEINLLAFIPIMNNTKNLMSSESSLKYFLTQAMASSILMAAIMMLMLTNMHLMMSISSLIMLSALMLKMGSAPFHFWFPTVMEGLTWMNSLILMTWQKIAPLMLLSYLMMTPMMTVAIISSTVIGSLGGLNQTSLRKLMAYSSINHIAWMLAAMMYSEELWTLYFIIYTLLSGLMVMLFYMFKIFHFNQLFTMFTTSKPLKFMMFTNLLSLGGLPPFLGFMPKWLVIQYMTHSTQLLMLTIMVMCALVTLFFYLRMSFSAFMLNYYETNWQTFTPLNNTNMNMYMLMSSLSLMGLPTISLMYFIM